jgi:hypothetical protein
MALMDISDLQSALKEVARLLKPSGWFVFSILHPCYHSPSSGEIEAVGGRLQRTVSGYWDEGYWRSDSRTGPPGKVGSYHRTLGTYLNALFDAGFQLQAIREQRATGRLAETRPIWMEVPATLVARCIKRERA